MRHLIRFFLVAAIALAGHAHAQTASNAKVVAACGTPPFTYTPGATVAVTMDTNGNLCQTGAGATVGATSIPALLTNYGILATSATTSTAVSTATASPNSGAITFPAPSKVVTITNTTTSTSTAYVCPLGGTCSSSVGIPFAVGFGRQFNIGSSSTSPTVACGSASANACVLAVEE